MYCVGCSPQVHTLIELLVSTQSSTVLMLHTFSVVYKKVYTNSVYPCINRTAGLDSGLLEFSMNTGSYDQSLAVIVE